MQRKILLVAGGACALALAACCCICHRPEPEIQPIKQGVDVFQTSQGKPTGVDFSSHPIPAGFFCAGSAPFAGKVQLAGVPLTTSPPGVAANGDTVVARLSEGGFHGGSATIPVRAVALHLSSVASIDVNCPAEGLTSWKVDACLCGNQPTTKIVAKVDQACGCGHFNGSLALHTCLRFTRSDGKVVGPIPMPVELTIQDMPWCPKPGPGQPVISGPFKVATTCDGPPDTEVEGTSNFFPGWTCDTQSSAGDCWTKYASLTHCHQGPSPDHLHCVNPICGREKD